MSTDSDLRQADTETITYGWVLRDGAGALLNPDAIKFVARPTRGGRNDTEWTTASGAVVDDGDGNGTWTLTAGDLAVGTYNWWALVTVGDNVVIPTDMSGTLRITDR